MAQPFVFVRTYPDGFSAENIQLLMREVLPPAQDLTSKPMPHVAIGLGSSGRTFVGFDVELPGLHPSFSIHAEQFLVANLVFFSEPKLDYLAVSNDGSSYHAPCGHCCQFLQEIRKASEIKIFTGPNEQLVPLGRFLPQSYSLHNAIQEHDPDVLQPRNNGLTLIDISAEQYNRYRGMIGLALAAANWSYAPYTNAPSGVVLKDCYGNMFSGSFMESVASNPSLGPVQAALINYVTLTGGRQFEKIEYVVLVETRSAFSQVDTAKIIMKKIAPGSLFDVFHCSHPA